MALSEHSTLSVYYVDSESIAWCCLCKVISPIFEKLAAQFPEIEFRKVDVDAQDQISQEVGVRAVRVCELY